MASSKSSVAGGDVDGPSFDDMEREYASIMASLSGDKSLERFRDEYTKVFNSLKKARDNEGRLMDKIKDLNNEIVINAAKVATALRLSEEDSSTIDELKKQVERAWGMVEAANSREEQANHQIERLQADNANYTAAFKKQQLMLDAESAATGGGLATVEDLVTSRRLLLDKLKEAEAVIAHERQRADEAVQDAATRQARYKQKKAQVTDLERTLAAKTSEEAREAKKRAGLEADLVKLREQMTAKHEEVEEAKRAAMEAQEKAARYEAQVSQQRGAMTESLNKLHKLHQSSSKLSEQLDTQIAKVEALTEERLKLEKKVKEKDEEAARAAGAAAKASAKAEGAEREVQRLQRLLDEERLKLEKKEAELEGVQADLENEMSRLRGAERTVTRLDREKSTAEKKAQLEAGKVVEARHEIDSKVGEVRSLEGDMRRMALEATKMRNVISVLERDRERLRKTIEELQAEVRASNDLVEQRNLVVASLEAREVEMNMKVKATQASLESLRLERNHISKALLEAQEEMEEINRRSKVQSNQLDQLKEDVLAKDRALVAEQFEHQSAEKRLEKRSHECDALRKLLGEANHAVAEQEKQLRALHATIRRLDADALAQKRAFDQVLTERDILGTQLIRRNDELALLYEKLAIQTTALSRGETAYKERMEDVRLLKIKIMDLKRELVLANAAKGDSVELRREMVLLQKELLHERTKVKALSDELENPQNVHRWRKLEGSDPATFEMIQKIQTLQKRLIAKTEEVVDRDTTLTEKEKAIAELEATLARQPGPELLEQLAHCQHLLDERTRQLKSLAGEVNMYQAQAAEGRFEIDRLTRELLEAKRSYYDLRKRERTGGVGAALSPMGSSGMVGEGSGSIVGGSASLGGSRMPPPEVAFKLAEQHRAAQNKPVYVGGGFMAAAGASGSAGGM